MLNFYIYNPKKLAGVGEGETQGTRLLRVYDLWRSLNFLLRIIAKQFDYSSKCLKLFQITFQTAKLG